MTTTEKMWKAMEILEIEEVNRALVPERSGKVRVWQLAKDLGVTWREIVEVKEDLALRTAPWLCTLLLSEIIEIRNIISMII